MHRFGFVAAVFAGAIAAAAPTYAAINYGDVLVTATDSTGVLTLYDYGSFASPLTTPTAYSTGLTITGSASADHDGILRMSDDQSTVVFGGLAGTAATVATTRVGQTGVTLKGPVSGYSGGVRSVASTDGNSFWISGKTNTYYYNAATTASSLVYTGDARSVLIAGTTSGTPAKQLYEVTSSGNGGVLRIGTGLPTSSSSLTQEIDGSSSSSVKDIPKADAVFLDENNDGHVDTAYTTGGKADIEKYYFDTSLATPAWVKQGSFIVSAGFAPGDINQLAVNYTGTQANIYFSTASGVYSFIDTNPQTQGLSFDNLATPTTLFSAVSGQGIRGLVIAVPEPASFGVMAMGIMGLIQRRRRNVVGR